MIKLERGNILVFDGDVIINTANTGLVAGYGLDGQIRKSIGPMCIAMLDDQSKKGGIEEGGFFMTPGGNLRSKYVLHVAGPIWYGGKKKEEEILRKTYHNCLQWAVEKQIRSMAFPAISTGIFRFPKDKAAEIAISEAKKVEEVLEIYFYCFDEENFKTYSNLLT